MKTRNNSSKAFHNNEPASNKQKSFSQLVDRILSKIDNPKDEKLSINAFKQIIERCYNNKLDQQELCEVLNVPFVPGPVSLNTVPYSFFQQEYLTAEDIETSVINQISYLFEYLKKTKEYYYCWIIYYNEELKLLTVKMMKKYELKENVELLNSKYCLVGIFVNRQVNLSAKKQLKETFLKKPSKTSEKLSAFSCYNQSTKFQIEKQQKVQTYSSKITQKITNSQSVYSLKSINSASKTNSSSFKNSKSYKQSQTESLTNLVAEVISGEKKQKIKNFKKKKDKTITLAETKIGKSMSSKFETSKIGTKIMKSMEKIQFNNKQHNHQSWKSAEKLIVFRSISNTDKTRKESTNNQFMDSNKIQLLKYKKTSKQFEDKQIGKRPPSLSKGRRLSKSSKIYSSSGSLNVTSESKNAFMKEPEQKIPSNLIKRKISSNFPNFKKKKLNPIKFQHSSKSSFDRE